MIFPQITKDLEAVSCRAVWRVEEQDLELAKQQICSKRLELDDVLATIDGVQFFISAITGLTSNAKSSVGEMENIMHPAVGFFIVYRKTETCDENTLFAELHKREVDVTISKIRTRSKQSSCHEMENAATTLFQVVKDHNNQAVQEMCDMSNTVCYTMSAATTSDEGETSQQNEPSHYPTCPCRVVVVNEVEFNGKLQSATTNLVADGMRLHIDSLGHLSERSSSLTSTTEFTETLMKIEKMMRLCDHALHRGHIYAKPVEASVTYVKMMDVDSYLNKLLATDAIREQVLKFFRQLSNVLAHPACEIVKQLTFDLDLIEVIIIIKVFICNSKHPSEFAYNFPKLI